VEAQAPRIVPALKALVAAVLLVAGCRVDRLAEVRPSLTAVLLVLGDGDGVDVFIGAPFTTGDPMEEMSVDAALYGLSEGLAGRIETTAPVEAVEDAVVAAVRDGFPDAVGLPLVDVEAAPHDATLTVSVKRYGLYAGDLRAQLSWYVEAQAKLATDKGVVWETTRREEASAVPAAVVGGGGGAIGMAQILNELSDEQIREVVVNLATRTGRAVVRKMREDAKR
jgi:hypothetical protein